MAMTEAAMGNLDGKCVLVTGGSRGIGAAIVRRLAADGANVAFTYNTGRQQAQQVAAEVREGGQRTVAIKADLTQPAAAAQTVETSVQQLGKLDILVNNAGITFWRPLDQIPVHEFDRLVAVDARAPFLLTQAASEHLQAGGRIINISSAVTSTALAGSALYAGVKAFLDQLTKVAAAELAPRRITVNAVAPGTTATGWLADASSEQRAQMGDAFSLGRIGEPEDTAHLVAFLASEAGSFITGQIIYNNGGQLRPVGRPD
jgi:3-oxoacyl-[acyl-carrier protein] reductase